MATKQPNPQNFSMISRNDGALLFADGVSNLVSIPSEPRLVQIHTEKHCFDAQPPALFGRIPGLSFVVLDLSSLDFRCKHQHLYMNYCSS